MTSSRLLLFSCRVARIPQPSSPEPQTYEDYYFAECGDPIRHLLPSRQHEIERLICGKRFFFAPLSYSKEISWGAAILFPVNITCRIAEVCSIFRG
jgi:hypothetical protein